MVQRPSQEVAWDRILAAENAKSVESKLRVESKVLVNTEVQGTEGWTFKKRRVAEWQSSRG